MPFDPRLISIVAPPLRKPQWIPAWRAIRSSIWKATSQVEGPPRSRCGLAAIDIDAVRSDPKRVVFAEGEEQQSFARPWPSLVRDWDWPFWSDAKSASRKSSQKRDLELDDKLIEIQNARISNRNFAYSQMLYERLQRRGFLVRDCQRIINNDRNHYAAAMVATGDADAMVTMTVFYPHPGQWPLGKVMLAGALMLGVSALAWVGRRRHPSLLMGWLWYCGTLVPVIQLVQTGGHAMADRYTYLPSLGVLILAVWGAYELVEGKGEGRRQNEECRTPNAEDRSAQLYSPIANRQGRSSALPPDREPSPARSSGKHEREIKAVPRSVQVPTCCEPGTARGPSLGHLNPWWKCRNAPNRKSQIFLLVAGGTAVVLCLALARQQIGYWQDSESLFRHALEVTANNYLAHNNLGAAVAETGQIDEAIPQYQETLRLKPEYAAAHYNLGNALGKKGQKDEAIRQYQEALRLKPDYAKARYNLGDVFTERPTRRGHQPLPGNHPPQTGLHRSPLQPRGALDQKGQTGEAILQYQEALRLKPDYADAHNNLGDALGKQGQIAEAISQFQAALRLKPDYAEAHFKLGKALGIKGQIAEAISELQEALRLKPDYAAARNSLASLAAAQSPQALAARGATLAGQGNYAEAIRSYQAALKAQPDQAGSLNNLAWLLATCPDATFRNGPEAVKLATRTAPAIVRSCSIRWRRSRMRSTTRIKGTRKMILGRLLRRIALSGL